VLVMVESTAAVDSIDAILKTPGLDGIMVGPADLAGHHGPSQRTEPPRRPRRDRRRGGDACRRHAIPFGIFAGTEQAAREWGAAGAGFMTVGADTQFLDQGLAKSLALARSLRESR